MTAQVLARSTRLKSRLPGGTEFQDIFGRVHVAVMPRSAIGARPHSNRQRHFRRVAPAVATGLATGKPAVHHHHAPPVPVGFVVDLAAQLAHADIGDCARQVMIRYWFSLIVLQAFDFKLDRRDEPHLNSQYLPPGKTFFQNT